MLNKVEPLRNELQYLSNTAQENIIKEASLSNLISELEQSIARYEQEYADLISQAQIIKADLTSVQIKVERSVALLNSLSSRYLFL
jgi:dynein heavy chain 1